VFEHQYGRPSETAEPDVEPIFDARAMTSEQRQAAIAELLESHPGLAALVPRTPSA
jgi:hypothetical protein